MARLHTRRHGKAKSRKPTDSEAKAGADRQNVEDVIVAYAKQGIRPAMIGLKLKQEHEVGYLKPVLGKRLTVLLKEKGFRSEIPSDMLDLMRKAVNMRRHITANHNDVHNKTRLQRVESKIWRLGKYYRSAGRLPADWKYDPEQAALIIKQA
ncbi:MAG: 30S ribosomal protein S15 [Candidatus Micrarchaeota archaeon]|nr:30S ribosomal protein S15 [Candidatus Micrarchaeota archaeon]